MTGFFSWDSLELEAEIADSQHGHDGEGELHGAPGTVGPDLGTPPQLIGGDGLGQRRILVGAKLRQFLHLLHPVGNDAHCGGERGTKEGRSREKGEKAERM